MPTKKSHLKSSPEMCLINLKGYYSGVPINTLEYESLKKIILLSNLRSLFLIKLSDYVYITEAKQGIDLDKLKRHCPDVYKNVFEVENNILNVELIIKEYPKYYDYIENFVHTEISSEHFKEMYSEIIQLMNSAITQLISVRVKIEYRKKNNINNDYDFNSSNYEQPKPITWCKSKPKLVSLFNYLADKNYIEPISEENLLPHFIITEEKNSFNFESNKIKPIVWKEGKTTLGYFLEYLKTKGLIKFYRGQINVAGEKHFISDENEIFKNVGQSRYNTMGTKNPEELHSILISVINSSQH